MENLQVIGFQLLAFCFVLIVTIIKGQNVSFVIHFVRIVTRNIANYPQLCSVKIQQPTLLQYISMMNQCPQTTHNKSDELNPSAYEKVNSEIEEFINNVDEEERKNNTVLHTKFGTKEDEKASLFRQIADRMSLK